MSYSPETPETEDGGVQMNLIPGSAGENNTSPGQETCSRSRWSAASSWCNDKGYRRLAICSIICGISCIGITALINSVKAEETRTRDPEKAEQFSGRARKFSIISIVVWILILVLTPALIGLISYILTLID